MNLHDISSLKRDTKQDNLYNLFEPTFNLKSVTKLQRIVTKENEMRIDLISDDIYKNINYADFLLDLNDIDNPLNIMAGDIIYYVSVEELDLLKIVPTSEDKRKSLLNSNKSNRDPNRQQYLEDNYQLSPTLLDNIGSPVTTSGSRITISPRQ